MIVTNCMVFLLKISSIHRIQPMFKIANYVVNPFPQTAILQQTTIRKILNVDSAERNEHSFKLSWNALKTLQEQFLPLSQCIQMSSAAADVSKYEYLWSKGLSLILYTML